MRNLRERGYFFYQISDVLNSHNIKPNRTKYFTPQLVFGSIKKIKIREDKMRNIQKPIVKKLRYLYEEYPNRNPL
jgi:hypothetical protein